MRQTDVGQRQVTYDYFRLRYNVLLECVFLQVHTEVSEEDAASVLCRIKWGQGVVKVCSKARWHEWISQNHGRKPDAENSLGQSELLSGLKYKRTLEKQCSDLREKQPLQDIEDLS
jgi:hypothetical protein